VSSPAPRRRRRLITGGRLFALGFLVFLFIIVAPTMFVVSKCWGEGFTAPMRRPEAARNIPNYTRDEQYTYLALPEWVIADTTSEYARFIAKEPPSHFPYFTAVSQYWEQYGAVCGVTRRSYAYDTGTHINLAVVGAIFSVENVIKAFYENSLGWLTERFSSRETPEDAFAAQLAAEYAQFMQAEPWYSFPFADRLVTLWTNTPLVGAHMTRKLERRASLSVQLVVKAVYASVVGLSTGVAYAAAGPQVHVWIERTPGSVATDKQFSVVGTAPNQGAIVALPGGEPFTRLMLDLHSRGVKFISIAGNDDILVTLILGKDQPVPGAPASVLTKVPVLTRPEFTRVALSVPVGSLADLMTGVLSNGGAVERIYDY
jgi:hypothetical protein